MTALMTVVLVLITAIPDVRVESLCGMLSSPVDMAFRSWLHGTSEVTREAHIETRHHRL
jgi:hypothetical protein